MIKTAFTCNSLRINQFFRFLRVRLSTFKSEKLTEACKQETAAYFKVEPNSVFLYGSARMGLYSLLIANEDDKRDEVIVAGYTCVVVTNAIKYAGAKAVYIDVEEDNLNIDPDMLRGAINENTKAIIFTHNYGITCEYIDAFKMEFPNIMIIEDAAHTFGSVTKDGRKAGTLGDASFFSLEYSKPLTSGMGGIVLVNNDTLREKIQKKYHKLSVYPFFTRMRILATLKMHLFSSSRYNAFLKRYMAGVLYLTGLLYRSPSAELKGERPTHYPVRLSSGLAYFAYMQLKEIEKINKIKGELAGKYYEAFKNIKGLRQYYNTDYVYARYPLLFDRGIRPSKIKAIKDEMKRSGIVAGEWFNDVVHPKGSFRYCYIDGSCPVGESVAERMINFPITIHKQLDDTDLKKAREILVKHLGE